MWNPSDLKRELKLIDEEEIYLNIKHKDFVEAHDIVSQKHEDPYELCEEILDLLSIKHKTFQWAMDNGKYRIIWYDCD